MRNYCVRWKSATGYSGRTQACLEKREARRIAAEMNERYAGRIRHQARYERPPKYRMPGRPRRKGGEM